jgi:hypothetical protein
MLGIPSTQDLGTLATSIVAQAQAAGVSLEDHESQILQTVISGALATALADAGPILSALTETNQTLQQLAALIVDVVAFLNRLDKAQITLTLATPPPPVAPLV